MNLVNALPRLVNGAGDSSQGLAYHEASHCLILLMRNRYPDKVTLDPPAVQFNHRGIDPLFAVQLHMAGAIGQALKTGRYRWSDGDIKNLNRVVKKHDIELDELTRIWRRTHAELYRQWDQVTIIAILLQRDKILYKSYLKKLFK